MRDEAKLALSGDFRIELLERAGRQIARILEDFLAGFEARLIDALEICVVHVDFAANFQHIGNATMILKSKGNGLDRARLGGDIVSNPPVAARGCLNEQSFFVSKR